MTLFAHTVPPDRPTEFDKLIDDILKQVEAEDRRRKRARADAQVQSQKNATMVKALVNETASLVKNAHPAEKADRAAQGVEAKTATARLVAEVRRKAAEAVAAGKISAVEAGKIEAQIARILERIRS